MQIISKNVNIKAEFPLSDDYIVKQLNAMNIQLLRWAIVNVDVDILTLSVACESL